MKKDTIKIKKGNLNVIVIITLALGALFAITFIGKLDNKAESPQVVLAESQQISPHYVEYSDESLTNANKNGNTVLFFAATRWCNTCSALDDEIKERSNTIPDGITILKVDYDTDKTTSATYGVTQQHTLVYLDRDGNEIKRWIGGDFDNLVQNIN